ncbi:MAG: sulfite exporter TauE/SafE family protein [Pseudomonadota bacterium]
MSLGLMDALVSQYGVLVVGLAFGVMAFGGFTKGAVGFALPTIAMSGIGSLMSVELALAALILPSLVTNIQQALRQGWEAARATVHKYWRLSVIMLVMIALAAQLVVVLPDRALFGILGAMVTALGTVQLIGWRPNIPPAQRRRAELLAGGIGGVFGGLVGVWGPPIQLYLLALETPKQEMVRAQGIFFLAGSVVLLVSHLYSGVLNGVSLPFSSWLILPAWIGLIAGQRVQDRLPQERFRRLTLIVLILAGLNLLRRALMG